MEKSTKDRLLDAALELLGREGARAMTVRAVEEAAGVPHGSVRHHFGGQRGLLLALFDHLERVERPADGGLPAAVAQWLGPGRTVALARYELFLLAARDAELRAPLVAARERFVAQVATTMGAERAPSVLAAIDGLLLDALVRGEQDPAKLTATIGALLAGV
ncbi:MAG: TetR family transcriptional regulator [Solirubrobacteraceae bacterium]|nr:TetR family transcriptional regulator [Solirubrobacteraceae bacterium]